MLGNKTVVHCDMSRRCCVQVYSEDPPDTKTPPSLSPLAYFVSVGLSAIARQQVAYLLEKTPQKTQRCNYAINNFFVTPCKGWTIWLTFTSLSFWCFFNKSLQSPQWLSLRLPATLHWMDEIQYCRILRAKMHLLLCWIQSAFNNTQKTESVFLILCVLSRTQNAHYYEDFATKILHLNALLTSLAA